MPNKARVFMSGRSQHVTIPAAFRFRSSVVSIRRDSQTGDVILSEVPPLPDVFAALDVAQLPAGFLSEADRDHGPAQDRPALDQLFAEEDAEHKTESPDHKACR
jgi:antitoxin VapB